MLAWGQDAPFRIIRAAHGQIRSYASSHICSGMITAENTTLTSDPSFTSFLHPQGPGTYKIPSANDIPVDFRVALLRDAPNTRAIHSSKVGFIVRMQRLRSGTCLQAFFLPLLWAASAPAAPSRPCICVQGCLTFPTPSLQAVGEPPFHLGASVFFALKDAVYAARKWVMMMLYLGISHACRGQRRTE